VSFMGHTLTNLGPACTPGIALASALFAVQVTNAVTATVAASPT
jgi:hypothetical protein